MPRFHLAVRHVLPLLLATLALALAACTPYGGELNVFGGVTSSPEDATHRIVFAKGGGSTEMITLRNMIVRRAAEDTLKAGFTSFEIVSISSETREAQYQTAAYSSSGCGKKGCKQHLPAGRNDPGADADDAGEDRDVEQSAAEPQGTRASSSRPTC